ncbi:riboflavin synthase [Virgibacillus alimentarius]|uniref:Riboflavin synthase n=1 Tax=Virgibacillus alimentarius TaxID=698769 RepID=A0ABS4SBM8_9BACI|nr:MULTISPECIES: riboflavin synthase [Virgibacillus]MBP2258526.1 riboflavin synthase [Virgibacillus alimentarius]HLR67478.1 riboflavin synthase [Virgibacillus sp.]
MFTGIVEEMGTIKKINKISEQSIKLTIEAADILVDMKLGDSIAVNGICLTVTNFNQDAFQVDVMPETIKSTSLNTLTMGSKVNLERSMSANGRFGGHFVSGHVDGIGKIITKQKQGNAIYYTIEINDEFSKFLLKKGSIAVDGVSLTVFEHSANTFTISLIPHTTSQTVLGLKGQGDIVNIECDMLAKYVNQIVGGPGKQKIDEGFLQTNGFM